MGEIEAAAAGHQELAPRRGHPVVDRDRSASPRQHFGGHQAGWSRADHGDAAAGGQSEIV
jgi:hypothetical protein